jgi:hypothetical protein
MASVAAVVLMAALVSASSTAAPTRTSAKPRPATPKKAIALVRDPTPAAGWVELDGRDDDDPPTPMKPATLLAVLMFAVLGAGAPGPATPHAALVAGTSACTPGAQGPALVLVATNLIHKGTLGSVILKKRLYAPTTMPCSQREEGALDDPALLNGSIATQNIYPGKQLTRSNVSGVLRISLTTPVRAGSYARLTVRVTPPARCTIQVKYDAVSKEKGLGAKTGGRITWRWKIGSNTRPGRWPIVVHCGTSGSLKLAIRVLS